MFVRQYLKLGGKFVAFDVDRAFAGCVEGLIVVDLPRANPRLLQCYMGVEGLNSYLGYHHGVADPAAQVRWCFRAGPKGPKGGGASDSQARRFFGTRGEKGATGDLGFEPRQTDPESVVLPLHQSPKHVDVNIEDA